MTEWVEREARLFRAGVYPDKQFAADEGDLEAMVAATGAECPLDLHHADTDETLPMGGLVPGSLRRDGSWLVGRIRLPETIDGLLRHRGLSVVIDRASKALRKITVTPRPRVAGAAFQAETVELEGGEVVAEAEMGASALAMAHERVLELERRLALTEARLRRERVTERIAQEVALHRVPPAIAQVVVPLAEGAGEVALDADGLVCFEGEPAQTLDVAAAMERVLRFFRGVVPAGDQLPVRDYRNDALTFEERAVQAARERLGEEHDPVEARAAVIAAARELERG